MKITDDALRTLHAQGRTASEIGQAAGISTSAVSQRLKRLGLRTHGRGNLRDGDRDQMPAGTETRLLPWLPGYSVAADGSIYSEHGKTPRKLRAKVLRDGRLRVRLSTMHGHRYCYVAVLVAEAWIRPRTPGEIVKYLDGNPKNVAANNLAWDINARGRIVSDEEFVRVWQSAATRQEVSEVTGLAKSSAGQKAVKLRRLGVPLKKLQRGSHANEIDIEGLKRIAEESEQ